MRTRWKDRMRKFRRADRFIELVEDVLVLLKSELTLTTASLPTRWARLPMATPRCDPSTTSSHPSMSFPASENRDAPSASANRTYSPLTCRKPCVVAPPLPLLRASETTLRISCRPFSFANSSTTSTVLSRLPSSTTKISYPPRPSLGAFRTCRFDVGLVVVVVPCVVRPKCSSR